MVEGEVVVPMVVREPRGGGGGGRGYHGHNDKGGGDDGRNGDGSYILMICMDITRKAITKEMLAFRITFFWLMSHGKISRHGYVALN